MNDKVFLGATESVCPECLRTITAVKLSEQEEVFLRKECPEHGRFQAVIWRGHPEYASWQRPGPAAVS